MAADGQDGGAVEARECSRGDGLREASMIPCNFLTDRSHSRFLAQLLRSMSVSVIVEST